MLVTVYILKNLEKMQESLFGFVDDPRSHTFHEPNPDEIRGWGRGSWISVPRGTNQISQISSIPSPNKPEYTPQKHSG